MSLARFARTMYRRRRLVVAVWLVVLVAVSARGAGPWGPTTSVDYTMPGSGSARAQALLAERFPEQSGDAVQLVFQAPAGVTDPAAADQHRAASASTRPPVRPRRRRAHRGRVGRRHRRARHRPARRHRREGPAEPTIEASWTVADEADDPRPASPSRPAAPPCRRVEGAEAGIGGDRHGRRPGHPARRLRLGARRRAAHRRGPVRPRASASPLSTLLTPRADGPRLGAEPRHDDRPRRRHRLRPVHRHPVPGRARRRAGARGRGRHGRHHRRPGRALRRRHRGDLPASACAPWASSTSTAPRRSPSPACSWCWSPP